MVKYVENRLINLTKNKFMLVAESDFGPLLILLRTWYFWHKCTGVLGLFLDVYEQAQVLKIIS